MKVTFYHHEYYVLAGMFCLFSALAASLMLLDGAASDIIIAIAVIGMGMVGSVASFLYARSYEVLDESGIRVKRVFFDKTYLWSDVEKLRVEVTIRGQGKGASAVP